MLTENMSKMMNACITFIKSCLESAIHSEQLASINYSKYNVKLEKQDTAEYLVFI